MRESQVTGLTVTWQDVLNPGGSVLPEPLGPLVQDSTVETFTLDAARSLAAHSLLVYRDSRDRHAILSNHGLKETFCTDIEESICSILEPVSGDAAIVVFRGTAHLKNWLTNIQSLPKAWIGGGHVHGGFADAHDVIWEQLAPRLETIVREGRPLFITGHSLGGALATLALSRIICDHGPAVDACAYTFGSPRVGNTAFARSNDDARLFRLVNNDDLVTRLPLSFSPSRRLSFLHAGDAYFLDANAGLHARGKNDLDEESPDLKSITEHIRNIPSAFAESRPPEFLADHAPVRYIDGLQRAHFQY